MSTMKSEGISERVAHYFEKKPNAMTMIAARELDISEAEVLRYLPGDRVAELVSDRFEDMMKRLESDFDRVHVIVSNGVTTLEAFGRFGNFSKWGEYFNVQTNSLDMHIRYGEITSVFAVEKPGHMDGVTTLSIQFYGREGRSAFKVFLTFGQKAPGDELRGKWEAFRDDFRL